MFTLMMTWKKGRKLMSARLREDAIDLKSFLESVFVAHRRGFVRTPAVFLVSDQGLLLTRGTRCLLHNMKNNKGAVRANLFVDGQAATRGMRGSAWTSAAR